MPRPFNSKGILFASLSILVALIGVPVRSEVKDFSLSTFEASQGERFRIAFWQDPDLSRLEFTHESFQEKLRRFERDFILAMEGPLVEAGFGDIKISIIDDYENLLEERTFGNFHLLHCDVATYLLPKNESFEPYTVLLEETPSEPLTSSHAVIWVTAESTYQEPQDLFGARVAIVDPYSLFGGTIQWARLWKAVGRLGLGEGPPFETVKTGAVSEGILRLVTGLGTESPIQAAFLPADGAGFQVAAQMLGLKRTEDLPIRILRKPAGIPIPGNPLLIDRYRLAEPYPGLTQQLGDFFESQKLPWSWKRSDDKRFEPLLQTLSPLRTLEAETP